MKQAVTAKVKLADQSDILQETMKTFSRAVQFCIDTGWGNDDIQSKRDLHDACYHKIRDKYGLQAQLAVNAVSQAHEMMKNGNCRSKPTVKSYLSIRYNFPRCASISGDWQNLSLSTTDGRVKFSIDFPECFQQYLEWDIRESNLIRDYKGRYFFCFVFAKEVNVNSRRDSRVLGVDLGVNKVAVTSDGAFYGINIKQKQKQRDEMVAELQSKGTRGAIRRLKEYGSTWKRFMDWTNHNISRRIVDKLDEGDVLVMEDLTYIRDKDRAGYNTWVHKWSFRDLQSKLEYKATLKGIRVVYIDPRNTSKRCSRCGSLHTQRKGQHGGFFKCNNCGYTLDADLNASRNISHTYTVTMGLRVACKPAHDTRMDDSEGTPSVCATEGDTTRKPLPYERQRVR